MAEEDQHPLINEGIINTTKTNESTTAIIGVAKKSSKASESQSMTSARHFSRVPSMVSNRIDAPRNWRRINISIESTRIVTTTPKWKLKCTVIGKSNKRCRNKEIL